MHAIEFTAELTGSGTLPIPQEVADQLPKTGRARIIVLTDELTGEADWRGPLTNSFFAMTHPRMHL